MLKALVPILLVPVILFLPINASQSMVLCISPDKCVSIEEFHDGRGCAPLGQSAQKSDPELCMLKPGKTGVHVHCIECVDIPLAFKLLSRKKISALNPIKISHLIPAALFTKPLSLPNRGYSARYLSGSAIDKKPPIPLSGTTVLLI